MSALRPAVLVVVLGLLVGCIFVVPEHEGGTRCAFAGESSDCGVCMRERCQAEIDTCCGARACASALALLDGCATTRDARCAELRAQSRTLGAAGDLGACAANRCAGACAPAPGTPRVACREPPLGAEAGCRCESQAERTNAFVCGTDTYPRTICCAPLDWPRAGQECTCLPLECSGTATGCSCMRVDNSAPRSSTCEGQSCCASSIGCTCRGTVPCEAHETKVEACRVETAQCPAGTARVERCSIFD